MNHKEEIISLPERLVVAADFRPDQPENFLTIGHRMESVRSKVLKLADSLHGTGVYLKVNSALRSCGYRLLTEIKDRGLRRFADLKLNDISETLSMDGELLAEYTPEILTVMCGSGAESMRRLKEQVPKTEVIGVTVLTSLSNENCLDLYNCPTTEAVERLAGFGKEAKIDGYVCSAKEVRAIRDVCGKNVTINIPAIRPLWSIVQNDDQERERISTPGKAVALGGTRVIVGRPITLAKNPREAVLRTLEEIQSTLTIVF